jgi:hypothetical protein
LSLSNNSERTVRPSFVCVRHVSACSSLLVHSENFCMTFWNLVWISYYHGLLHFLFLNVLLTCRQRASEVGATLTPLNPVFWKVCKTHARKNMQRLLKTVPCTVRNTREGTYTFCAIAWPKNYWNGHTKFGVETKKIKFADFTLNIFTRLTIKIVPNCRTFWHYIWQVFM